MAAPFTRHCRPLWRIITGPGRINTLVRTVYSGGHRRAAHDAKPAVAASPWVLHGAVCLQRLPVLSHDKSPIEVQFMELMSQMELERSLLSDHEMRLLEDSARMSRKQEDDYDSDEEDYAGNEIVTAQDLEDSWEQKMKQFQPAPRSQEEGQRDVSCPERCLADSLVLLVKREVGGQKLWLLPQVEWQDGETLRQTAQRALASITGGDLTASFLGNAPCGFYKYKYPKDVRTESRVGAKVFFFKAVTSSHTHSPTDENTIAWVKQDELQDFLKPDYLRQVARFLMDL